MSVYNDNNKPISDVDSECSNRPYEPGKYYNGNVKKEGGYKLKGEGSLGLEYDQGAIRCSEVPEINYMGKMKDNVENIIPQGKQGSAAHLKS